MTNVLWLHEVSKDDIDSVGEKAAYLGELIKAGLQVPTGFVITTDAYREAFPAIANQVNEILTSVNISSLESLDQASRQIRELFLRLEIPSSVEKDISDAYKEMFTVPKEYKNVQKKALDFIQAGRDRPFLMLRSSPTIPTVAQQASFLDTSGVQDLLNKVKLCWASLFTPRAIYYRKKHNLEDAANPVIVQQRKNLLKSGTVLGINPLTNNKNQLLIQARWGFSERDAEESDMYVYDMQLKKVESKSISQQETLYIFDPQIMKVAKRDISDELKGVELLSSKEIELIDAATKKINSIFKFPQDIEWGIAKGKFHILQSRPITSLVKKPIVSNGDDSAEPVIKGMPASPGNIQGRISTTSKPDHILLARKFNSGVFKSVFGASALIVETGDLKSLPAVISREMEIPCVVRVNRATEKLQEGSKVSLDAFSGKIYLEQPAEVQINPTFSSDRTANPSLSLEPESGPISVILEKLSDLEATITELVLQEAQKRRDSTHEIDEKRSKMISDLEWEVRSLKEKVEKVLGLKQDSGSETLI